MVAIAWQVDIQPGASEAFEKLYGADGDWTKLSRRSRSFLGSSFLRELGSETRYLLIEYWSEMVVYEKHLASFDAQLKELEASRATLVQHMQSLGVFTALDTPSRTGPTWSRRSGA